MQPSLFKDDHPARLTLALSGVRVLMEANTPDESLVMMLSRLGVESEPQAGMISIHVKDLRLLRSLELESVLCDYLLSPIWRYTEHALDVDPALLEVVSGDLRLSWKSGSWSFDEVLDTNAVSALLASNLPFAASDHAWDFLSRFSNLPVAVATARKSPYGFYVLQSSKPQLLAAAPLPGLFRINQTTFGLSNAYERELLEAHGITVEPALSLSPPEIDNHALAGLSDSSHATALDVLEGLQKRSGVVLVSPHGASRRVSTLAALAALGATPVLVVAPPWGLWAYQRAASFLDIKDSIHVVTPTHLASMVTPPEFGSMIIDDPLSGQTSYNEAIARLDSIDTYKVAVCSSWPVSEQDQLFLLARVRPQEFDDKVPIAVRYPSMPHERFTEHLRPFVRRSVSASGSSSLTVEVLDLSLDIVDFLASNKLDPLEVSLVVSFGTPNRTSPKFASTISHINRCRQDKKRVVVLSIHEKFLDSVSKLMSPNKPIPLDASMDSDGLSLCLLSELPDLSGFDEVILVEWPNSISDLEAALAPPSYTSSKVTVLHMRGSIDDLLAASSLSSPLGSQFPAATLDWNSRTLF